MPKLSIVIPTKNRYETLFPVIKSLLKYIQGSDYEIVVNDNSDNNLDAIRFLEEANDERIAYYYTNERLTQSGNSNSAISKAKGDYITFIGDDDFVSPYIMTAINLMELHQIECLQYNIGSYCWSGVQVSRSMQKHMMPSQLVINSAPMCDFREVSAQQELKKVLDFGGIAILGLPRLYHGILSRNILNKMLEKYGSYVVGSCPDMNTAVLISSLIEKYTYVNFPLTVSGASSNSASGMNARNSHRSDLESLVESGFLPKKILTEWNVFLPKVWTVSTIWAQTLCEALKTAKIDKDINYTFFYVVFFFKEFWARKYAIKSLKSVLKAHKASLYKIFGGMIKYSIKKNIKRVIGPLLMKDQQRICLQNITSIDKCMQELLNFPFNKE